MYWETNLVIALTLGLMVVVLIFARDVRHNPPDLIHEDRGLEPIEDIVIPPIVTKRKLRRDPPVAMAKTVDDL